MLEKELQNLGLTEKEIKVYIAALELGEASVQEISRKSGVNRATTYIQIESLINRGLLSNLDKTSKNYVIAERPSCILNILEKQKTHIEALENSFAKLMPELDAIYNVQTDKPRVRFYEKEAGLDLVRNDIVKTKPEILYFIMPKLDEKVYPVFDRMAKAAGFVKVLYIAEKNWPDIYARAGYKNVAARFFQMKNFDLDITIYNNKVLLNKPIARDESSGILVEDKMFYKSFIAIFELFWQMGRDLEEKKRG